MNIHKTKIEWCSHTWNPVTGCRHDCPYCYARRIATRFGPKIDEFPDESGITAFVNEGVDCYVVEKPTELKDWQGNYRRSTPYPKNFAPTLHKYTLTYPEKRLTPAAIFVGSMADLFGRWVPDDWIEQVFDACRRAPRHTYLFLTKNPQRYDETGIRHLREVKLWEVSVVTWAMNPEATVIGYKAAETADRAVKLTEDAAAEVKEGRKISSARLKTLKEASETMKKAAKTLDALISEVEGEKAKSRKRYPIRGLKKAPTQPTIEITL